MTICDYYDRLESEGGSLVRIVTAEPQKKDGRKLDVYKEYEDGRCVCRNLYTSMYGYRVGFPGDSNSLYRKRCMEFIEGLEDYGECRKIKSFASRNLDEAEKMLVCGKYGGFKYVLRKYEGDIENVLAALRIWKEHPEIELILAAGFENIALNRRFWTLTERKRREVASFLRKHPDCRKFSLLDVQMVLKHKISASDFSVYKDFCRKNRRVGYELFRYLVRIGMGNKQGIMLYRDYHNLLLQTQHDADDDYWRFPKDLQGKHDELFEEVQRINDMLNEEKLKLKQAAYHDAVSKLLGLRIDSGGYSVYIPETVEEICRHARALHQCLIAADYVTKVIQKECVLVFVSKGEKPVATAQVFRNGSVGQFYADELDRDDCLPSDEVRMAMNEWLKFKMTA